MCILIAEHCQIIERMTQLWYGGETNDVFLGQIFFSIKTALKFNKLMGGTEQRQVIKACESFFWHATDAIGGGAFAAVFFIDKEHTHKTANRLLRKYKKWAIKIEKLEEEIRNKYNITLYLVLNEHIPSICTKDAHQQIIAEIQRDIDEKLAKLAS